MKKSKMIVPIIIVLLVAGVAVYWFLGKDKLKVKAEEIPFGLEWGMTEKEFLAAMEDTECIPDDIEGNAIGTYSYRIYDYQGIEGANALVLLKTDEGRKLTDVSIVFSASDATSSEYSSEELIDLLQEAFEKAYKKQSKEVLNNEESLFVEYSCYYVCKKSTLAVERNGDNLYLFFTNVND